MSKGISLSQAIESLRKEITEAVDQAEGKSTQFKIKDIELELSVVATGSVNSDVAAEAGVSVWNLFTGKVNAGVGASETDQAVHRIKLTLATKFYDDKGKEVDRNISKSGPNRPIDPNVG